MTQIWNPAEYQEKGSFVPTLGEPLLDLLAPQAGMRILDVGCGDGTLTQKIVERGATVMGIDASEAMVAAAQAKGIDARHISAYDLAFENEFDAAFSNAALHWMTEDPARVLRNIARALKPGGRFVVEMGGQGNIRLIREAQQQALTRRGLDLDALAPKFFPSPQEATAMLESAGFQVSQMELFNRPTRLPDGMKGWLRVFATAVLSALPLEDVETYLNEVEALTRPQLTDAQGWFADYVRLRFVATKP
jgi:trans-aconitate methyltransferase